LRNRSFLPLFGCGGRKIELARKQKGAHLLPSFPRRRESRRNGFWKLIWHLKFLIWHLVLGSRLVLTYSLLLALFLLYCMG